MTTSRRHGLETLALPVQRKPGIVLLAGLLTVGGAFGFGLVSFIGVILLAVVFGLLGLWGLTALSIVGMVTANTVLGLVLLVAGTFLGSALVSYVAGKTGLAGRVQAGRYDRVLWLLAGALLFVLLTAIPVVGFLVTMLAALVGIGGLAVVIWTEYARRQGPTINVLGS